MQKCPEIARGEIEALRADGIEPTLDEMARLMHWGALVECPAGRVGPQPEDAPVELAGRVLWPLSMAADAWLDTVRQWLPGALTLAAFGLAAERSREPDGFVDLYSRKAALAAVERWCATFAGSQSQLTRALTRLVPELLPSAELPADPAEDAPLLPSDPDLAQMVAATGLPAEYWLQHTSRHYLAVLRAIRAERELDAGIPQPEPSKEPQRQLLCVVALIRKRATDGRA
jgi:hypothetical protein